MLSGPIDFFNVVMNLPTSCTAIDGMQEVVVFCSGKIL